MMALHDQNDSGRLAQALMLDRCREATLRLSVGELVTVTAVQYATSEQCDRLARAITERQYVLVPRDSCKGIAGGGIELTEKERTVIEGVAAEASLDGMTWTRAVTAEDRLVLRNLLDRYDTIQKAVSK